MEANTEQYPVCRHLKTNGRQCQSPALSGGSVCFFHRNLHRTHRRPQTAESLMSTWREDTIEGYKIGEMDPLTVARAYPKQNEIHFPPLEDAESVQLATSMLFQAIATGKIHFRRARILLYTLKIATVNLRAVSTAARFTPDSGPVPSRVRRTAHGHTLAARQNRVPQSRVPHDQRAQRAYRGVSPGIPTEPSVDPTPPTPQPQPNDDFAPNPNQETILPPPSI